MYSLAHGVEYELVVHVDRRYLPYLPLSMFMCELRNKHTIGSFSRC